MPTKGTLTKLRVKRRKRQFLSKNAKRKTRAVKSMRKHRKSMKKWMMKGGFDDDDFVSYKETQKSYTVTAYVLYDEIPVVNRRDNDNANMYAPVCVIFVKPVTPLDEIYLVFNGKITAEDITLTVKLLLGIDTTTDFQLTPPITIPETTSKTWHGNKFVKICKSSLLSLSYGIETGPFGSFTQLDKVSTTKHGIITKDTKYRSLDGKKIKASLDDTGDNGFKNRVLTSKGVLPNLYKGYFISRENPGEITDEIEVDNLFGKDLEPNKNPWDEKAEPYEVFKKKMKGYIRGELLDVKHHNTYGLDPETVKQLNETRPLKITAPKSITYYDRMLAGDIIQRIINSIKKEGIEFNSLSEKWWTKIEEDNKTSMVNYVLERKEARVNSCIDHPGSRDCYQD